ncbi:MAG: TatD family hydrolase [Geobacteraceae bacterium]|nr:TatD family hydrolase [Geobacteraceae bacterium]
MLVDAHAHIDWYTDALNEALGQIEEHRILTMAVAMDVPAYLKTVEIARSSPYIIPTFGIHPWEAARYVDKLHELDDYLEETPVIGEAGLDFHYVKDTGLYPGQITVFEYQCSWARRLSKPMNLHTRGAEREVLEMLNRFGIGRSIIHWYAGPLSLIESYLAAGCYFTLGVDVLNPRKKPGIAQVLPIDRILLETDNPDGYRWLANEIGMPDLLLKIMERVAESKGMAPAELENRLWQNWQDFAGESLATTLTHV